MELKEEFPIMMNDDTNETETHRIVYLYPEDIDDLSLMIDTAITTPKIKFSKRFQNLIKLQKQFKAMK